MYRKIHYFQIVGQSSVLIQWDFQNPIYDEFGLKKIEGILKKLEHQNFTRSTNNCIHFD